MKSGNVRMNGSKERHLRQSNKQKNHRGLCSSQCCSWIQIQTVRAKRGVFLSSSEDMKTDGLSTLVSILTDQQVLTGAFLMILRSTLRNLTIQSPWKRSRNQLTTLNLKKEVQDQMILHQRFLCVVEILSNPFC